MNIRRWSGSETRMLREASRLTVREFSRRMGVSTRMVSKWEAGGDSVHPRPSKQALLDAVLAGSSEQIRSRFTQAVHEHGRQNWAGEVRRLGDTSAAGSVVQRLYTETRIPRPLPLRCASDEEAW
ncbi:helix-turn-helix domain-containing protein [Nocardia suismassiliense]|uniref:helix-turn-helix domain-containing protein n=1 Tax=Nocardia suismassiliense TaxID=2077092 RepID=UPI00131F06E9